MASRRRILLVDDDEDILELIQYNLEKEGYEVKTLQESEKTLDVASHFSPHLIILDIMMPGKNGITLCRKLRSVKHFKDTYIFFLTAKSESYYQHAAFDTGGDDYIEKVIGLKALTRKIAAVLNSDLVIRKAVGEITFGDFKIIRAQECVYVNGKRIFLSKAEFEVLFFLAQNARREISSEILIQSIWGSEVFLADNDVELYIYNLRKKIGPKFIIELKDRVYYFKPDV